jgi:hypothetical protein
VTGCNERVAQLSKPASKLAKRAPMRGQPILPLVAELRAAGVTSMRGIAAALNARGEHRRSDVGRSGGGPEGSRG